MLITKYQTVTVTLFTWMWKILKDFYYIQYFYTMKILTQSMSTL